MSGQEEEDVLKPVRLYCSPIAASLAEWFERRSRTPVVARPCGAVETREIQTGNARGC